MSVQTTFGPLGVEPVKVPSFLGGRFFLSKVFIGDLTAFPIPMHHCAIVEQKLKTNALGAVSDRYFRCLMFHSRNVARNSDIFFSEDQVSIELFISPNTIVVL